MNEPYGEPFEEAVPELEAYDAENTYGDAYDEAYDDANEQEEAFDADDLPDAPQWPKWDARMRSQKGGKQSKAVLFSRIRKPEQEKSKPFGIKRRGVIAQMLDPQVDSIKGLPPMVDPQSAFQKPTYPTPRWQESEGGAGPWDEDS